jgi:nitrate reductase alpha subunit
LGADDFTEDRTSAPGPKDAGVPADKIVALMAREFASNAEDQRRKSMVILGCRSEPLVSHGYELRGIINMLVMCANVLTSPRIGGVGALYVSQEKLRPQNRLARNWLAASIGNGRHALHMEFDKCVLRHTNQTAI